MKRVTGCGVRGKGHTECCRIAQSVKNCGVLGMSYRLDLDG